MSEDTTIYTSPLAILSACDPEYGFTKVFVISWADEDRVNCATNLSTPANKELFNVLKGILQELENKLGEIHHD